MTNSKNTHYAVTKKDLDGVYWRWLLGAALSWNYENQQAGGIMMALEPVLRKIYPDDEEYKSALLSTYQYYNSHRKMTNLVLGAVVAVEEKHDDKDLEATRETVTAIKTSLMGPFAGIGDSLLSSIPMTICASISAYLALQGNPAGLLVGLVVSIALQILSRWFLTLGYRYGTNLMTVFADKLKIFTSAAQILGVTVVGGLVAANVNIPIALSYTNNDVVINFQNILDSIMPKMTSVIFVGIVYWILGRKKMTTGKCILILLAISFVLYILGIVA